MKEDFMRRVIGTIAAATLAFSIITPLATAQQGRSSQQATTGRASTADQELVWRVPHVAGALRAGRPDQPKITDVPPEGRTPVPAASGQEMITQTGVFGVVAGHQTRHLALDPKTGAMFVGVGSSGNIGVEPEVKASIQRFEPDGSGQTTFASGMRNPPTLAFHPGTGELSAGAQEP